MLGLIISKRRKEDFQNLRAIRKNITEAGDLYRAKIRAVLKEIQAFPEAADFTIELTDINGQSWKVNGI